MCVDEYVLCCCYYYFDFWGTCNYILDLRHVYKLYHLISRLTENAEGDRKMEEGHRSVRAADRIMIVSRGLVSEPRQSFRSQAGVEHSIQAKAFTQE